MFDNQTNIFYNLHDGIKDAIEDPESTLVKAIAFSNVAVQSFHTLSDKTLRSYDFNLACLAPNTQIKKIKSFLMTDQKKHYKSQYIYTNVKKMLDIDGQNSYLLPAEVLEMDRKIFFSSSGDSGNYTAHFSYYTAYSMSIDTTVQPGDKKKYNLKKLDLVDSNIELVFIPNIITFLFSHYHEIKIITQMAHELIRIIRSKPIQDQKMGKFQLNSDQNEAFGSDQNSQLIQVPYEIQEKVIGKKDLDALNDNIITHAEIVDATKKYYKKFSNLKPYERRNYNFEIKDALEVTQLFCLTYKPVTQEFVNDFMGAQLKDQNIYSSDFNTIIYLRVIDTFVNYPESNSQYLYDLIKHTSEKDLTFLKPISKQDEIFKLESIHNNQTELQLDFKLFGEISPDIIFKFFLCVLFQRKVLVVSNSEKHYERLFHLVRSIYLPFEPYPMEKEKWYRAFTPNDIKFLQNNEQCLAWYMEIIPQDKQLIDGLLDHFDMVINFKNKEFYELKSFQDNNWRIIKHYQDHIVQKFYQIRTDYLINRVDEKEGLDTEMSREIFCLFFAMFLPIVELKVLGIQKGEEMMVKFSQMNLALMDGPFSQKICKEFDIREKNNLFAVVQKNKLFYDDFFQFYKYLKTLRPRELSNLTYDKLFFDLPTLNRQFHFYMINKKLQIIHHTIQRNFLGQEWLIHSIVNQMPEKLIKQTTLKKDNFEKSVKGMPIDKQKAAQTVQTGAQAKFVTYQVLSRLDPTLKRLVEVDNKVDITNQELKGLHITFDDLESVSDIQQMEDSRIYNNTGIEVDKKERTVNDRNFNPQAKLQFNNLIEEKAANKINDKIQEKKNQTAYVIKQTPQLKQSNHYQQNVAEPKVKIQEKLRRAYKHSLIFDPHVQKQTDDIQLKQIDKQEKLVYETLYAEIARKEEFSKDPNQKKISIFDKKQKALKASGSVKSFESQLSCENMPDSIRIDLSHQQSNLSIDNLIPPGQSLNESKNYPQPKLIQGKSVEFRDGSKSPPSRSSAQRLNKNGSFRRNQSSFYIQDSNLVNDIDKMGQEPGMDQSYNAEFYQSISEQTDQKIEIEEVPVKKSVIDKAKDEEIAKLVESDEDDDY